MKKFSFPKKPHIDKPLLAAVCLPVLLTAAVLIFTCVVFGLFPFGDGSLCWCDMRQQGLPLLMMFREALLSGKGLLHMPGLTGGSDFLGVAAFFLMNPGSLLSIFWKPEDLLDLLNLLVFGKLLLCAATAGYFFVRRFRENGVGFAAVFGAAYALCGYGLLYYQNLMWLDVMALFPLFLLACYALLERGRLLPYTLLMAACMVLCFYIGFMVAIFALLFFGVHFLLCPRHRRRNAVRFVFGSSVAALLSAPVWLPTLCQLIPSARSSSLAESLKSGRWGVPYATALPLLLCSAGLFALLIVTALSFPRWNKKTYALLILNGLLLLPMILEPINRMWHMGSYMCFPCRFAFMPIFLGLTLVAHLWSKSPTPALRPRKIRIALTALCAVIVLAVGGGLYALFSKNAEALTRYIRTLWSDAAALKIQLLVFALVASVAAFIALLYRGGFQGRRVTAVLLGALLLCESAFHSAVYIGKVPSYWQFSSLSALVDLSDKPQDATFLRAKTESDLMDSNMLGALGYPSLGGYTSLVSEDTLFTAKKLGYSAGWMDIGLNGGTLFSDMLLSVGYTVNSASAQNDGNTVLYQNDAYRLEKLPYTQPLGFLVDVAKATKVKELPTDNRLHAQEHLARELFGKTNLFTRYNPSFSRDCAFFDDGAGGASYTVNGASPLIAYFLSVTDKQTLYLDCFNGYSSRVKEPVYDSFRVEVNGNTVCESYPNSHDNGFLNLGTFQNQTVTVLLTPLKSGACASFGVFGLHHTELQSISTSINTANISYKGGTYTGTFIAEKDDCLLLTIPYAKGFSAIVDGKRRRVERTMDNFIRVPLQSGESAVKLVYVSPGLVPGVLLCLLGIALLILRRIFSEKAEWLAEKCGKIPLLLTYIASGGCAFTVYVLPLFVLLFNS